MWVNYIPLRTISILITWLQGISGFEANTGIIISENHY